MKFSVHLNRRVCVMDVTTRGIWFGGETTKGRGMVLRGKTTKGVDEMTSGETSLGWGGGGKTSSLPLQSRVSHLELL